MKTLIDIPTKGDHATLTGGMVIRVRDHGNGDLEYITHDYSIVEGRRGYHNGGYWSSLSQALADLSRCVERSEGFDLGGAIDFAKLAA